MISYKLPEKRLREEISKTKNKINILKRCKYNNSKSHKFNQVDQLRKYEELKAILSLQINELKLRLSIEEYEYWKKYVGRDMYKKKIRRYQNKLKIMREIIKK